MYLFVEKGIRGCISYIAKRYSKDKNKYIKFYNDSKPSKYIMYLDANNFIAGQCVNVFLTVNLNG